MELSIHRITKIRDSAARCHPMPGGGVYRCRELLIETDCGEVLRLTLFADDDAALEIVPVAPHRLHDRGGEVERHRGMPEFDSIEETGRFRSILVETIEQLEVLKNAIPRYWHDPDLRRGYFIARDALSLARDRLTDLQSEMAGDMPAGDRQSALPVGACQ